MEHFSHVTLNFDHMTLTYNLDLMRGQGIPPYQISTSGGQFVQKLSSEHTHSDTHQTDCITWTTKWSITVLMSLIVVATA